LNLATGNGRRGITFIPQNHNSRGDVIENSGCVKASARSKVHPYRRANCSMVLFAVGVRKQFTFSGVKFVANRTCPFSFCNAFQRWRQAVRVVDQITKVAAEKVTGITANLAHAVVKIDWSSIRSR